MGKASRRKKEQKERRHTSAAQHAPAADAPATDRQVTASRRTTAAAPARGAKPTITSAASAAYMDWLREAIQTQRKQMERAERMSRDEDAHVLAPLVRRMGQTPSGRSFTVDLSPVYDPSGARYILGLAVAAENTAAKPDAFGMPQFNPGIALAMPYELRAVRSADAVAWLAYRAISDGKVNPDDGEAISTYASRAAVAATPSQMRLPRGILPLPSNALFDYEGFGDSAAEEPVSPELTPAQRQRGPSALPAGDWLIDDPADISGSKLVYGIEEVRDCTDGLWVVEHFELERLIDLLPLVAEERPRIATLTHELLRSVDEHLAEDRQTMEESLREGLATPAEIAEEVAPSDTLRNELRAAKTVQEALMLLARALFELNPPMPEQDEGEEVLEGAVLDT